ncbi:cycloartenol-C-24-methyltransferase 1 isoform X1 [Elaeis guineensis]|uniref:cycloartenol-C-24-methyltransferase 1 isoform X1 n=1 Tax=Elaeis guineensis var. tenera TaxID=51953 RepID=UPI003C6D45B5
MSKPQPLSINRACKPRSFLCIASPKSSPGITFISCSLQSFSVTGATAKKMSDSGALSSVANAGGRLEKARIKSTMEQYKKYHGGNEGTRKANAADMVNKYYDLVTRYVEYTWGESFHFASRCKGETFRESIKRHEHFLALQLGLKRGMKVLDVGCGIGGPLREIARFSLTSITGLNNNEYQISRAKELNRLAGFSESCKLVKGNFMDMPFPDNTFDGIYAIEATSYATDLVACYKEICRVLKPGQCFAAYELCLTDHFDPRNEKHQKIKADIELGSGLLDIRTTSQCLEALKLAGFEVVWERDRSLDSEVPWYLPFDAFKLAINNFRSIAIGRCITRSVVSMLEFVGLAPAGSSKVHSFLEKDGDALVEGGRDEIFTPMYFFLARKPLSNS